MPSFSYQLIFIEWMPEIRVQFAQAKQQNSIEITEIVSQPNAKAEFFCSNT